MRTPGLLFPEMRLRAGAGAARRRPDGPADDVRRTGLDRDTVETVGHRDRPSRVGTDAVAPDDVVRAGDLHPIAMVPTDQVARRRGGATDSRVVGLNGNARTGVEDGGRAGLIRSDELPSIVMPALSMKMPCAPLPEMTLRAPCRRRPVSSPPFRQ